MGLDIGGTASRWVLCGDDGQELARGKAPGATGHVFNPAEKDKLRHVLAAIAAETAGHAIASVTAGLTGYGAAVSDEVKALLKRRFIGLDAPALIELLARSNFAARLSGEAGEDL